MDDSLNIKFYIKSFSLQIDLQPSNVIIKYAANIETFCKQPKISVLFQHTIIHI